MLTAMTAVDNIAAGRTDKSNLWAVNTEMDYHEEKATEKPQPSSDSQQLKEVKEEAAAAHAG
jgi:hypothetical protein